MCEYSFRAASMMAPNTLRANTWTQMLWAMRDWFHASLRSWVCPLSLDQRASQASGLSKGQTPKALKLCNFQHTTPWADIPYKLSPEQKVLVLCSEKDDCTIVWLWPLLSLCHPFINVSMPFTDHTPSLLFLAIQIIIFLTQLTKTVPWTA